MIYYIYLFYLNKEENDFLYLPLFSPLFLSLLA